MSALSVNIIRVYRRYELAEILNMVVDPKSSAPFDFLAAMDDIESKAKHYFILFSRERTKRQELVRCFISILGTILPWKDYGWCSDLTKFLIDVNLTCRYLLCLNPLRLTIFSHPPSITHLGSYSGKTSLLVWARWDHLVILLCTIFSSCQF